MRGEIARIDAHDALEDTVSTRAPEPSRTASLVLAAVMLLVVLATALAPLALIAVEYEGKVVH
jgi:hypothetical protein